MADIAHAQFDPAAFLAEAGLGGELSD